jgi:hypothetical protein
MSLTPKKLAIYYGWPSAVNGSAGDVNAAVAVFKEYDAVVFGAGLEDTGHGDHANTVAIISHVDMLNSDVYGYISAQDTNTINWGKIDAWNSMGVDGIFCDEFGYDFNVDRNRQNVLVEYIHYKGLKAFVNAWNPDDVFLNTVDPIKNPLGTAHMLGANDIYLAESYQIINGNYQSESDWRTKSDKMDAHRTTYGTGMAAIATAGSLPFDQAKWDYAYYSAVADQFMVGWGEEFYSAASASLPMRSRKMVYGTYFKTALSSSSGVYERNTNVGVLIDTVNHTVSELTN